MAYFFYEKISKLLIKATPYGQIWIKVRSLLVAMKKTLKFIDTEYANFTFLSDEQKRKNYSTLSLLVASRPYEFRRGYATDKQPYNEEMRILYIGASSLLKLYYYKRRERLRLFFYFSEGASSSEKSASSYLELAPSSLFFP